MERFFTREIDSLPPIFTFIDEFVSAVGISPENAHSLGLVIEELFTNMVRHNAGGDRDVRISIDRDADRLIVSLTDFDVEPFDITRAPEVDTQQPLAERTPGGLGIHFVRRIADDITYEYKDRRSTITLTKSVEA